MSLFGQSKRFTPTKGRRSPLPLSTSDAVHEKYTSSHSRSNSLSSLPAASSASGWFTVIYVPLPQFGSSSSAASSNGNGDSTRFYNHSHTPSLSHAYAQQTPRRHFRIFLPLPPVLYSRIRHTSPRRALLYLVLLVVGVFVLSGFRRRRGGGHGGGGDGEKDTTILTKEEIARIWEWEVLSGHHPSIRQIPDSIPLPPTYPNPSVPYSLLPPPSAPAPIVAYQSAPPLPHTVLIGSGPERTYLEIKTARPPWERDDEDEQKERASGRDLEGLGFPPRPVRGSVMDMDRVFEKCDFGTNQYVRDCLEYLRIGGHLDNGRRSRRTNLSSYQYIFTESALTSSSSQLDASTRSKFSLARTPDAITSKSINRIAAGLSRSPLTLDAPISPETPKGPCDPLRPRIFHMFWAGPFTDKPYMAVASFLFTQNLDLHLPSDTWADATTTCRPQFWVWINPGPAAAVPNPSAKREMYEALATNPWSAPFLHARFKDVVKFKMWNTTEQLDNVGELKDHWRSMPIFNSGGDKFGKAQAEAVPPKEAPEFEPRDINPDGKGEGLELEGVVVLGTATDVVKPTTTVVPVVKKGKNDIFEKVGTTSEKDQDRLSVILSDMARFILTHRYGGIYLDADTIFLRDWEELWNWKGQFAYRWSWHQKYNTAVLKLHKGSALGTFLFKTALENGLDFHPMTVSRYLKDAGLDSLLYRLPDALFDSAWLTMEGYQRERPPFPYIEEFADFFLSNKFYSSAPHPLGYDGFYRGSFSYHFHNCWWLPFDPARNFPDLGPRFIKGERFLKDAAKAAKQLANKTESATVDIGSPASRKQLAEEDPEDEDERDLSWATVIKRTYEAYIRGERPNMYGEWLRW